MTSHLFSKPLISKRENMPTKQPHPVQIEDIRPIIGIEVYGPATKSFKLASPAAPTKCTFDELNNQDDSTKVSRLNPLLNKKRPYLQSMFGTNRIIIKISSANRGAPPFLPARSKLHGHQANHNPFFL